MNTKIIPVGALYFMMGAFGIDTARGIEGIAPTGPIGGTDIRSALLPPPGFYGVGVGVRAVLGDAYTETGKIPASGAQNIGGIGLLYVHGDVLGGTVGSSLFAGYSEVCYGGRGTGHRPCESGATDLYSDLFLWSYFIPESNSINEPGGIMPIPYGLAIQLGLGVSVPVGAYDAASPVNVGSNFFDIAPSLAFTYTVPSIFGRHLGQATEFSARSSFNYYTENADTNYQTGNIINIDYAISQRWDNWQFGVAGNAWTQVADDEINGVKVGSEGNRATSWSVGPLISYDFLMDDRLWNITFKSYVYLEAPKNTIDVDVFTLRLSTKFF